AGAGRRCGGLDDAARWQAPLLPGAGTGQSGRRYGHRQRCRGPPGPGVAADGRGVGAQQHRPVPAPAGNPAFGHAGGAGTGVRQDRYRLRIRRRPALRSQPPGRPRPARDDGRRRAPSLRDAALAGAAWRGRSTLRGWSGQSPGAGMRLAGKIIEWNDERGFGFIARNAGSQRVFAHVRDFEGRARRPVVGDPVTYEPGQDARGRPMATRVRNVRQPAAKPQSSVSRFPRTAVALVALSGVGAGVFAGLLPLVVGFAYLFMTGVSYFMYWADKSAAQNE